MTDVAVIGAGPAGLAAARTAAHAGCRVALVDAGAHPGGQYLRRLATAPTPLPDAVHPLIDNFQGASVWAVEARPGGVRIHLRSAAGEGRTLRARALVLATGAYDRTLPFPGWDLPGVFTAGGLQALVKGQGVLPGRRVVVAGSGPFLLPVAAALATAGARVVAVCDASHPARWARHLATVSRHAGKLAELGHYLRVLRRHRVPIRFRHAVVRADGDQAVGSVTIARLAGDWTPLPTGRQTVAVDAVGVGFGFVPSAELALALGCDLVPGAAAPAVHTDTGMRTSVAGVYAAGEITGVGGAALADVEGRLAGASVAADLGFTPPAGTARDRRRRARALRFAAALDEVYAIQPGWQQWLTGETLVCRCEEVPVSAIHHAVDDLAITDLRSIKLTVRAGMGMCQGRVCGPTTRAIAEARLGHPVTDVTALSTRPIAVPVSLRTLADVPPDDTAPTRPGGCGTRPEPAT